MNPVNIWLFIITVNGFVGLRCTELAVSDAFSHRSAQKQAHGTLSSHDVRSEVASTFRNPLLHFENIVQDY